MAIILKKLISTLACILTYTMNELIEYAPQFIKGDAKDIFDFEKVEIPEIESNLNEEILISAKEKFSEAIDTLKKEKIIKSTLELAISTDSKDILDLEEVEAQDWFLVSSVSNEAQENILSSFEIQGSKFTVALASDAKCPRCWKFTSKSEETLCIRCESVVK
jgi:isoleucyl-tRNA synthetase